MNSESFASPAWRMVGLTRSIPGVLALADDTLTFTDEEGTRFRAPLAAVSGVTFPWYYFGGGMKLVVDGTRYRLAFVRPNDADDLQDRLASRIGDAGAALNQVTVKVTDIRDGRQVGRRWRQLLAP
jgi:hypothetical protein